MCWLTDNGYLRLSLLGSSACSMVSSCSSALQHMSGFTIAVRKERFALHKMRSASLAIGIRSVLFLIDRDVDVFGTLAIAGIDETCCRRVDS